MAFISMSLSAVKIITGPLAFLNMIVNVLYAFCLIFPPHSGRRKQPLTTLLGFLVSCTIAYCVCLVIVGSYGLFNDDQRLYFTFMCIIFYFVDYSIISYVWLNFYYYLQIVPSSFALVLWVKRNIMSTTYVILAIESLLIMLSRLSYYIRSVIFMKSSNDFSLNGTTWKRMREEVKHSGEISFCFLLVLLSVSSCVMVVSSLSTVCYLHRHIKSVTKSGTSFSAKTVRAQVRVTITGTCQGVLFFLYAGYLFFYGFSVEFMREFHHDVRIFFTSTTLFISGTTVTLGIGQTAFRQRIMNMYKALKHVGTCQKTH